MPPWRRATSPDLTVEERQVITFGCFMMGAEGPSELSAPLAKALGFDGAESAAAQLQKLSERIERAEQLSATEWAQAMVCTELAFISELLGAASDWDSIRGGEAEQDLATIRNAQAQLWAAGVRYPLPRPVS